MSEQNLEPQSKPPKDKTGPHEPGQGGEDHSRWDKLFRRAGDKLRNRPGMTNDLGKQEANKQETKEAQEDKEKVRRYMQDQTDFPDALIDKLLSDVQEIDASPLSFFYEDSQPGSLKEATRGLMLVHLTDWEPEDGYVLPRYEVYRRDQRPGGEDNVIPRPYRTTIHSSVSYPVASHGVGYWADKRYAVMTPLDEVAKKVAGFKLEDTYTVGPLEVGEGGEVLEFGDGDLDAAQREMLENGLIDRTTMFGILSELVGKGDNLKSLAETAISGDWVLDTDYIRSRLPEDHPLIEYFDNESLVVSRFIESPTHFVVVKELLKMGKLPLVSGIKEEASPGKIFQYLPGESDSLSPWEHSGLVTYLKDYYKGRLGGGRDVTQSHASSVWADIERVYDLAAGEIDQSRAITELTRKVAEGANQRERVERAIALVRPGGELWRETLTASWRSPALVLYSYKLLRSLEKDLSAMQDMKN